MGAKSTGRMAEMRGDVKLTPEVFETIFGKIADGESLRSICRQEGMPATSAFFAWMAKDPLLQEQYARAREAGADADAEDVTDIGKRTLTGEFDPAAARVAIDALKWAAGKKQPKVYGDKAAIEHSGPNGGAIVQRVERIIVDPKDQA
jgi:hypothetical protein